MRIRQSTLRMPAMIQTDTTLTPAALAPVCWRLFEVYAPKIRRLQQRWDSSKGSPVFTWAGEYTTRGWTEWTQGFQFGSALLQFDATGEEEFLTMGREATVKW